MNTRNFILRETLALLIGEVVCAAAMIGVFAMLGYLDYKVFLGAALGIVLAVGNFFIMAIASDAAADKTMEQEDTKTGKAMIKASYSMRMVIIGILLFLFAKSGHCNLIAMVVPLFVVFPILMVIEFFRKSGGAKS